MTLEKKGYKLSEQKLFNFLALCAPLSMEVVSYFILQCSLISTTYTILYNATLNICPYVNVLSPCFILEHMASVLGVLMQ